MKPFSRWLFEFKGGEAAGSLEIHRTSVNQAYRYAVQAIDSQTLGELKSFNTNYKFAQKQAATGWMRRREMPVIGKADVPELQNRLQQGLIRLIAPYDLLDESDSKFRTRVQHKQISIGKLNPIQKQIYVDKAIDMIGKGSTLRSTINFLTQDTLYITSSDNYIIDGHHRFLAAMLIDPNMQVRTISIDLPIKVLLPLAVAYGDLIGNIRNK